MKNSNLNNLRHSCSHLLAAAVLELWPNTKVTLGPPIENGFYYDFDFGDIKVSETDIPKIEQKMHQIVKSWKEIKKIELSNNEAMKQWGNNLYKKELIKEIIDNKEKITAYQSGNFIDLCRGGHIEKPCEKLKYFKILSIAGAYWRGNEKNNMLTRIYGTVFPTKEELDKFIWQQEEAKKRDHRKLGRELDLFVISENIGKGLPLLTPKGTILRNQILQLENKLEIENGFSQVFTPHIARSELYKKTGHWQHYRDVMYAPFGIDGEEYVLKPMNCPHHYMIYASKPRSYKDLPIRLSEPGTCYRFEKTGELAGLLRVRSLSIDDGHILMTEDQIEEEFKLCIDMVKIMFKAFQLNNYYVRLSLADPSDAVKYIADTAAWKKAGNSLEKIIKNNNLEYKIALGEASFYGPKIDFMVKDSIGREWQMSTLQLDLFMAKRLNLTYTDQDGKEQHPVILHRGLTGSIERTLAILIEHFSGAFPLWLSPIQIAILPVSDKFNSYVKKVENLIKSEGFRVEVNYDNKTLGAKIRQSTLQKIPYMIIIGERESEKSKINNQKQENLFITVRTREGKDLGLVNFYQFIKDLKKQVETFL